MEICLTDAGFATIINIICGAQALRVTIIADRHGQVKLLEYKYELFNRVSKADMRYINPS
jgi:hypothetical protein